MGLCIDSRQVKAGDSFFCIHGTAADGHDYIVKAVKAGADSIVYDDEVAKERAYAEIKRDFAAQPAEFPAHFGLDKLKFHRVADTLTALNQACGKYYDYPSHKLLMFGVTGTNGKTTVANVIAQILDPTVPCGCIGTLGAFFHELSWGHSLTTPDAIHLHSMLRSMLDAGAKAAAMEVSSHGLSLGRVDAIDFDTVIFTNFTQDHLDYHKTMEQYFAAKLKLFTRLKEGGTAVLNADIPEFSRIRSSTKGKVISYAIKSTADYKAENLSLTSQKSMFDLTYPGGKTKIVTNLLAAYNVYNLLAAIAALHQNGLSMADIADRAKHLKQISGRLESIDEGQDFTVIVDFAHTPDAMEKVFTYALQLTKSFKSGTAKIIAVFGSAGLRDESKRPIMGEVADKYCDRIILTTDDPRTQSPQQIAEEIRRGIKHQDKCEIVIDRQKAIEKALDIADKGDVVLILGKGDDDFLPLAGGDVPWPGDHVLAAQYLRQKLK